MKFLIVSDIHGSAFYMQKIIDTFNIENCDKLIILGDVYNHGPRNPLPKEYNPMKVAEILNGIKDKIIVVKGNCDSQVDTLISEFSFVEDAVIVSGDKTVFCTHGHVYNKDLKPKTKFDAVIYGHFHTGFIVRIEETVFANAGSVSLPKDKTDNSYLILDKDELILKNFQSEIIAQIKI